MTQSTQVQLDRADTQAPASEGTSGDLVGDDLANQIQAALDESRGQAEPAAAAPPASSAEAEDSADAQPQTIDQIDQMLAESADETVAGDFESISEVLESEVQAAEAAAAAAAAASEPAADLVVPVMPVAPRAAAAHAARGDESDLSADEPAPEGEFECVDAVLRARSGARAGAAERDEPPAAADDEPACEPAAAAASAEPAPAALTDGLYQAALARVRAIGRIAGLYAGCFAGATGLTLATLMAMGRGWRPTLPLTAGMLTLAMVAWVRRRQALTGDHWRDVALRDLHRLCEVVNRPAERVSAPVRGLIGWVGVVQILWAGLLIVGKIAFSLLG